MSSSTYNGNTGFNGPISAPNAPPRIVSDALSQYVALRTLYARKSAKEAAKPDTSVSPTGKARPMPKPAVRIVADCSHVHWPGQEVSALISVDEAACEESGQGWLDELVAEISGQVYSFVPGHADSSFVNHAQQIEVGASPTVSSCTRATTTSALTKLRRCMLSLRLHPAMVDELGT